MLLSARTLRKYQTQGSEYLREHGRALLLADMGGGKTVTTLTALLPYAQQGWKTYVFAPALVAETVWHAEVAEWAHLAGLVVSPVVGRERLRWEALEREADIYVISHNNIAWFFKYCDKRDFSESIMVVDELSRLRSRGTWWKQIRKHSPAFGKVWGLTGTPNPNGLTQLWPQVDAVLPGLRNPLGRTHTQYIKDNFYKLPGDGHTLHLFPGRGPKIYDAISPHAFRVDMSEQLDLEPEIIHDITVPLNETDIRLLRKMERELFLEQDGSEISAVNAGVLTGKLLQMANGSVYDDDKKAVALHDYKIAALKDLVEGMQGQPLLVAYSFRHDLSRLRKAFPQAEFIEDAKDMNDLVTRWNAGEIPMLAGHPGSFGHGMNLQHGCNHIAWFGLPYSLELYEQTNARIGPTRQAQSGYKRPTFVHRLLAADTIEQHVVQRLDEKSVDQQSLLDAIKEYQDEQ